MQSFKDICLMLATASMFIVIVKGFTMDMPTRKKVLTQLGITFLTLALIIITYQVLKWAFKNEMENDIVVELDIHR